MTNEPSREGAVGAQTHLTRLALTNFRNYAALSLDLKPGAVVFTGDNGAARYRGPSGERRLSVRRCATLNEATLYTTTPLLMNDAERDLFGRVEKNVRLSRYGGDCYAYCMLAAGHVDLVIEAGLKAYDIAALVPIVTGAGGIVTTWDGGPAHNGGNIIAASDPRVHEAAMKLLNA